MKKFILCFISVVFPFITIFVLDLPGAAFVALGLQSTIFGWPVASIWAIKETLRKCEQDEELREDKKADRRDNRRRRRERQQ